MKKFVSLLTVLTLLISALAILPVSANDTESTPSLDNYLLTHWDFSGDDVYADKALAGTTKDQLSAPINASKITCNDGVVTLNGTGTGGGPRYLFAPDSEDLFRTPMADATNDYDRTLFIKFKISEPTLTGNYQRYEIVSQNGALRLRNKFTSTSSKNELQSSTVLGSEQVPDNNENTISNNSLFAADTWLEVAICYDKGYDETTGQQTLTYTMYAKDNTTGAWSQKAQLNSSSDPSKWYKYTPAKDWQSQDCKNANNATSCDNATKCRTQTGCENYFCIGANPHGVALGNNCDLLVDDIRVYGKALTTAELGTINVTESQPSDPLPPPPEAEKDTMISKGHSLTLSGMTNINYYFDFNEDADYEANGTETVTITDEAGEEVMTCSLNELERSEQNGYKLSYGVSAKQMSESFTLTVKNGDTVLYTDAYSVRSYAIYVLENSSNYEKELIDLVKTMLNYGAYAQVSFNYSTDNLANEGYVITPPDITVTEGLGAKVDGTVSGLTYSAATLVLNNETHVAFKFNVNGVDASNITVEGYEDYKIIAGKTLQIQSAGLVASDLDKYVQVTVKVGDESVTVSYSPLAFIMNMANDNGTTKDLVKALYAYHLAAKNYVK